MTPAEMLQYINDNYDDYSKCVEVLMRDGMDEEAAHEHVAFNVLDAGVAQDGGNMPVFVHDWRKEREEVLEGEGERWRRSRDSGSRFWKSGRNRNAARSELFSRPRVTHGQRTTNLSSIAQ